MPILTVEIVVRPGESLDPALAGELANRGGEVFGSPPNHTWVMLRAIASEHYAENGNMPFAGIYPVFVSVLKASLPGPDLMGVEVAGLTHAVAQACGRPEEIVHIIYLPAGAGRVAFGGQLI